MKVRLTTDRATMFGPSQRDGDVIDVADAEGLALIRTRQAEPLEETAAMQPPENAKKRLQPTRK